MWGTASSSNIEVIRVIPNENNEIFFNIPYYVSNKYIYYDLNIKNIKDEITRFSKKYQNLLKKHSNHLAFNLLDNGAVNLKRLDGHNLLDLSNQFGL